MLGQLHDILHRGELMAEGWVDQRDSNIAHSVYQDDVVPGKVVLVGVRSVLVFIDPSENDFHCGCAHAVEGIGLDLVALGAEGPQVVLP